MRTPIPKPANPDATAKFTIESSDHVHADGISFTNGIAPVKGQVIPRYAWTGGQIRIPSSG